MTPILRDSAFTDLEGIAAWIARDRPIAAAHVVEFIFQNIERLARFPLMGHAGRVDGTLEWVVPNLPYIVVYTIDESHDELVVIGVFHGAQER
jgi:plasmid stabilization system protein ParE